MDCCSVNGLDKVFSRSVAQRQLKNYLKKGLGRRAQQMVDFLKEQEITGATILEIGAGIGSLHLELIKAGAAEAVGYDASPAYVEAATALAERLGLKESVEYHLGDFVELAFSAPVMDIVILDRVICCYPDMNALMTVAGQRTKRLCVLTYPRRARWVRIAFYTGNLVQTLLRREFRAYLHHPQQVSVVLGAQGLSGMFKATAGFLGLWEIAVYQRQEAEVSPSS